MAIEWHVRLLFSSGAWPQPPARTAQAFTYPSDQGPLEPRPGPPQAPRARQAGHTRRNSMRFRSTFLVAALLLTGTASVVSTLGVRLAAAQDSAPTARLVPDRPSFEAGRLATFVGQGFEPGETVTFQVTRVHGTPVTGTHHTPLAVVADPSGAFPAIWQVCDTDCVGELLRIEAAGQTSGRIGRAMFMDLPALPRPGSRGDLPSGFVTEAAVVPTFERIWSVGSSRRFQPARPRPCRARSQSASSTLNPCGRRPA